MPALPPLVPDPLDYETFGLFPSTLPVEPMTENK